MLLSKKIIILIWIIYLIMIYSTFHNYQAIVFFYDSYVLFYVLAHIWNYKETGTPVCGLSYICGTPVSL